MLVRKAITLPISSPYGGAMGRCAPRKYSRLVAPCEETRAGSPWTRAMLPANEGWLKRNVWVIFPASPAVAVSMPLPITLYSPGAVMAYSEV